MKSTPEPFALGRSHRNSVSRDALATCSTAQTKRDPLKLLRAADKGRVPSLIALKYQRMRASAFGFFRGAASIMAYDLSLAPHTGILTQLCGDAHVQNLGAYSGLDGRLVFDINDFDETIRGPFEWDIKRMATSILLAGEQARLKPSEVHLAATSFLSAYTSLLHCLAPLPILEVARFQVHRLDAVSPISKILAKAERSSPLHSLDKLTERARNNRVFRSTPPLLHRVHGAERKAVLDSLNLYRKSLLPERQHFLAQYRALDVAFKVVGTGSVGLRDYCIYMEGNGPNDPLFLQVKEEVASAFAPYLPNNAATQSHNGQRAADGQRAMQLQSDPMLGWTSIQRRDYLVRQLNDHKASLDVTTLDAVSLIEYAEVCGELLARGHARSGDARILTGYVGKGKSFRKAILDFATAYAKQSNEDWKTLIAASKKH